VICLVPLLQIRARKRLAADTAGEATAKSVRLDMTLKMLRS
jgi:hypothetical protein